MAASSIKTNEGNIAFQSLSNYGASIESNVPYYCLGAPYYENIIDNFNDSDGSSYSLEIGLCKELSCTPDFTISLNG